MSKHPNSGYPQREYLIPARPARPSAWLLLPFSENLWSLKNIPSPLCSAADCCEGRCSPCSHSETLLCRLIHFLVVVVVQSLSHVRLCDPMDCSSPGFPVPHISRSFLKFTSIASAIHPTVSSSVALFSFCLQSFPSSGSFLMSWLLHQVAKVLEFQFHFLAPHQGASLAGDPPVMGVIWLSKVPWGIIKLGHQLNASVVIAVVSGGLCSQMKLSSSWTTQTHLLLPITHLKEELGVFLRGRELIWNQLRLTWMRPAAIQRPSQRRKLELTPQSLSASAPHLLEEEAGIPLSAASLNFFLLHCYPRDFPPLQGSGHYFINM